MLDGEAGGENAMGFLHSQERGAADRQLRRATGPKETLKVGVDEHDVSDREWWRYSVQR